LVNRGHSAGQLERFPSKQTTVNKGHLRSNYDKTGLIYEIFWISRERPHVTQIMWNHCRNKLTPDWKYIFNHFFDFQFYRIIFISPSHSVIKDYFPTIFQLKTIKKSPKVVLIISFIRNFCFWFGVFLLYLPNSQPFGQDLRDSFWSLYG